MRTPDRMRTFIFHKRPKAMKPVTVNEMNKGSYFGAALRRKSMWKIIPLLMLLHFVAFLVRIGADSLPKSLAMFAPQEYELA
jgi:hypothetical protein